MCREYIRFGLKFTIWTFSTKKKNLPFELSMVYNVISCSNNNKIKVWLLLMSRFQNNGDPLKCHIRFEKRKRQNRRWQKESSERGVVFRWNLQTLILWYCVLSSGIQLKRKPGLVKPLSVGVVGRNRPWFSHTAIPLSISCGSRACASMSFKIHLLLPNWIVIAWFIFLSFRFSV